MTPFGHTLVGLTIGYTAIPRAVPPRQKLYCLAAFALLANLPDLPLPFWGHPHAYASHSIAVCLMGSVVFGGLLLWRYRGRFPFMPRIILAGSLAWLSHMILDAMYSWGVGLPIAWPFGRARLALPVSWLHIANKSHVFSMHNFRVAIYEVLTFGPPLLAVLLAKHIYGRAKAPAHEEIIKS